MIGGIAGGTVPTAMAYLADISNSEDKAKNFGLIGAAFGIGFVLGPFIGGILGEINFRLPFFFSAALSLGTFLLCYVFLTESLEEKNKRKFKFTDLNPFISIFKAFLMIRRPPRSTQSRSSAASDVYKRQIISQSR